MKCSIFVQRKHNRLSFIWCMVAGTDLAMEMDTGAGVTIVSEETFRQLQTRQSMNLSPSEVRLWTCSNHPIEVVGECQVSVQYRSVQQQLPLVVVAGKGSSLLGRNWLMSLGIHKT